MFEIGTGDGGLGFQLSMDRLYDAFRDARRARESGTLEQALSEMIERYNALVRQYNDLLAQAQQNEQAVRHRDAELRQKNERIAELEDFLADARRHLRTLMYE